MIPNYTVNGGRKLHVVKYSLRKVLKPYVEDRESLLVKCTPITINIAKGLVNHGYKLMSKFGRWCPVKVSPTTSSNGNNSYIICHNSLLKDIPSAYLSLMAEHFRLFTESMYILCPLLRQETSLLRIPIAIYTYLLTVFQSL